jgi:hypothetical protein
MSFSIRIGLKIEAVNHPLRTVAIGQGEAGDRADAKTLPRGVSSGARDMLLVRARL